MPRLFTIQTVFLSGLILALSFSPAFAQIKIGLGAPITGGSAFYGELSKNGAEQAVEDINAKGGILGQKIELEIGDDGSNPQQGAIVADKFVSDNIKFVIGHANSNVSIATSDIYTKNNILQISPTTANSTFTERGLKNVFRICGRDDLQSKVTADHIAKHFRLKKIAIIHDGTTYGKGLADETKKDLNATKITEVLYEGVKPAEKDYSDIISKIKTSGADLIYWGGLYPEAASLLNQMREQGVKATFMGGSGIATKGFADLAGKNAIDTLMVFDQDLMKLPAAASLIQAFETKKIHMEGRGLYSYAAVQVLKQAIEKAKSLDPVKVAQIMHSGMIFDTVVGKFSYNAKGDRNNFKYVVYIWKTQPDGTVSYETLN